MSSLVDPASGQPLVNVAQVLADPAWLADVPASAANPLASKIGWLDIGNHAAGVLGLAAGFATTVIVSLLGRRPSTQAILDSLHAPRS
jgi:Na+(H+)/acetate symporter ActP